MSARRALACITVALAGTWGHAKAADSGRISAGQEVAAQVCSACHGLDGNAPNAQFPKLAGQVSGFTALQLRNYRSGERPNPIMATVAKALNDAQIEAVAAYYASLAPMRPDATADAGRARKRGQIYQVGNPGAPAFRY